MPQATPDTDLMSEFDELPTNEAMLALTVLIKDRQHVVEVLAKYEDLVERGKKRLKQIDEDQLPEALDKCNQDECVIKDLGIRVQIKEDTYANIPAQSTIESMRDPAEKSALQERLDQALTWLDANAPDVVKRKFDIQFGRTPEDVKLAAKFERDLAQRKHPLKVLRSATVHPQTLNKLVRDLLEEGHQVPRDILGVYTKRVAKVTQR